jgi:hypothetical protein
MTQVVLGTQQRKPHPRNRKGGLADLDMSLRELFVTPDGITMSAGLKFLPERSYPVYYACLGEVLNSRCDYRARYVNLPHDADILIPAYGTSISTQEVQPGSWLWGWSFASLEDHPEDFTVQMTEVCSGHQFFVSPVRGTVMQPNGTTGLYPVLVPPFKFRANEPQIKVEITNRSSTDQRCQLLLCLAEPCSPNVG